MTTSSELDESSTSALSPEKRIDAIDVVRGVALFGVLIVNVVTEFRVSIFQQFLGDETDMTAADLIVSRFVSVFLEMKAFTLFSILFGLGLAMQFERLSSKANPYYLLARRLIVLALFGACHLLLVWHGDILTEYALAGLLVLPLIGLPTRALAAISVLLLTLFVALPWLPAVFEWPDATFLNEHVSAANQIYAHGSYREYLRFSVHELRLLLPLHIYVFPRTLALFFLGAFLWKSGLIRRLPMHRRACLVVATTGVFAGLVLTTEATPSLLGKVGSTLQMLAPVVLALGYGALICWVASMPSAHRVLRPFAAVGRMAFSNYILQSLIFGIVFFGFGLGMFARLGVAQTALIGTIVYAGQALLSTYWLKRHLFGPLEWLWRSLMYGIRQPMRRSMAIKPAASAQA